MPGGQHTTYTWAHVSSCTMCPRIGYICLDGCTLRKALETRRQLRNHHYKQHDNARIVVEQPVDSIWDGTNAIVATPVTLDESMIVLNSTALQTFLTTSIRDGMVMAIRHLVCGACFSTSRLALAVIQTISLQDTYIVLLLTRLVFRIGSVHNVL